MNKNPNHLRSFRASSMRIVLSAALLGSASFCFAQQPASTVAAQQAAKVSPATTALVDAAKPVSPKQKQLTDDTAKLQALANELKAEMDKSSKDTLSLTVIKKAEEVEKLAHKVEAEMKANLMN